jgi:CDP-glycerol glycerophosphotransferase
VRSGERRRVAVTTRRAAEYQLPDVPGAARHDYGGFDIHIPESALGPGVGGACWKVELTVLNRGITRRHVLNNPVAGAPRRPPYHRLGSDAAGREVWARLDWDAEGELLITVEPLRARLTAFGYSSAEGVDTLELSGDLEPEADGEWSLRLVRRPGTAELDYPLHVRAGRFRGEVPVTDLLDRAVTEGEGLLRQERWQVTLCGPGEWSQGLPVVLPEEIEPRRRPVRGHTEREIAVERTTTGHVRLRAGWARPSIEEARWDGDRLVFAGRHPGLGDLQLVVKAQGRSEEHPVACEREGDRFRAVFAPAEIATQAGAVSLAAGTYELWGRLPGVGDPDQGTDTRAEISPELLARLPLKHDTEERTYSLTALDAGRPVLRVGSDLRAEEKGTYAQRMLREQTYPQQRREPLREEILFDSYTGRQCSDSPYGIYAELRARGGAWAEYPMNWLVDDGQIVPPHDTGRVRRRGREFYESLARSRFLVTNSRQPHWFDKRPDQTVVQTWHGSMLKRIGFDIDNIKGKTRDYHDKLAWETRQWDYLVSPSPWATPILRRAFRFEGEILETGYPRNDIFYAAERELIAADTRKRLGLNDDRKVILYAPTWRDDKYYTRGKHKLDLHLDLRHMYEALGEDHVLLVRPHPRVVDRVPSVGRDFVYDVSRYPEIMELFLITDVLVTDYSSMMFDFANTGRPMLFFTYDLESYRDQLRGFYFDFEQTAPGPLLQESEHVVEAIADLDSVHRDYAGRYESFVRQFCPLDDGGAAARIVDRVFGAQ